MNMTNEEMRIKIAEACGWTEIDRYIGQEKMPEGLLKGQNPKYKGGKKEELPDYLNDLNAMHEAEKICWTDKYRYDYNIQLDRVVGATPVKGPDSKVGPWIYESDKARHATAAQRAISLIKTLNLEPK